MQGDALNLVAQRAPALARGLRASSPEDGLSDHGDDGYDVMLALARKIVAGEDDVGSVESVFVQAQQIAAEVEALLVDAPVCGLSHCTAGSGRKFRQVPVRPRATATGAGSRTRGSPWVA